MGHVQASYLIPASREHVFAYICDLARLEEDLSPELQLKFTTPSEGTSVGDPPSSEDSRPATEPPLQLHAELPVSIRRFGMTASGLIRIERLQVSEELMYRQESGWFTSWRHAIHLVEHSGSTPSAAAGWTQAPATLVSDLIDYRLPFGLFGSLADDLFLKRDIGRILRLRATKMQNHFEARAQGLEFREPRSVREALDRAGESSTPLRMSRGEFTFGS